MPELKVPKILFATGNAAMDATRGWFIGQFIPENEGPRHQKDLELKWGVHPAADRRSTWVRYEVSTTIAILLEGRFQIRVRKGKVIEDHILETAGDYVVMAPGLSHTWEALSESVVLTVRFPSLAGDQREEPAFKSSPARP